MSRPDRVERNDALAPDFMDLIASLNAHRVQFVLVGGYAVAVYGVVRATGDIDFFYRRTKTNVRNLMAAMAEFGAPESCINEAALLDPNTMTFFGQEPLRIDLVNSLSGVTFQAVWEKAVEIALRGQRLRVIGINELIANKRATGRYKDTQDARKLERSEERSASSPTSTSRSPRTRSWRD